MQKKRPTKGRTSLPRCRITGTASVYQRPEKRQHNPSSPKENPSKQERDKRQSRKHPRARRSSSKNAKSMRYNAPAYGTWVLSDYITAGKQPACFHYATLARTKAHTFGTFRHPTPTRQVVSTPKQGTAPTTPIPSPPVGPNAAIFAPKPHLPSANSDAHATSASQFLPSSRTSPKTPRQRGR